MFFNRRKRPPPEKVVPQSVYDALVVERDALAHAQETLTKEVADLTSKYSALGFDYAQLEGLARKALALLLEVDTTRSGGMALFRKRSDLMREATAAGLLEEEKQGEEQS